MAEPSSPRIIRGSREKSFKAFLIMVAIAGGCAIGLSTGKNILFPLSGVVYCGFHALQNLVALIVPPKLVIDDAGLRWRGIRSWRVAWSEVERFRIMTLRRSSTVLIDYRDGGPDLGAFRRLRRPKAVPGVIWMRAQEIQELLQERLEAARAADPSRSPALHEPEPALLRPVVVFPWFSIGLILALTIVFAAEILFPITPADKPLQPSVMTLIGFGGLSRGLLTGAGQWYRFAAAPFLHASLPHLIGNAIALFLAGRLLERVVSRRWFAAIYAFGALTGGLGSLLLNPAVSVSVGASGAILALFAATYVCSFHFPLSAGRHRLQSGAFAILVPTLLTLGKSADGMIIDLGDHLGGALGGALVGLLLLRGWDPRSAAPSRQRLGLALGILGGIAVVSAVGPAISRHATFRQVVALVPGSVMQPDPTKTIEQAPAP